MDTLNNSIIQKNGCWITINRACNLRCKWCYAQDLGFNAIDDLPLEKAKEVVDFSHSLGIKSIVLLGGEPTVYKHLPELIKYISSCDMHSVIISNGIRFADINYVKQLKESGLDGVALSLKGNNEHDFFDVTGCNQFEKVLEGIKNLNTVGLKHTLTMVLTGNNIQTFIEGVKNAKLAGSSQFSFSFCYNYNCNNSASDYIKENNPYFLTREFGKQYDLLNEITNGSFMMEMGYPLCVWETELVEKMTQKGQLSSICQLLKGNGLIFDSNLNLIPCNAMYNIKYGQFGKDFTDKSSFLQHMNNPEIIRLFNKLQGVPDETCLTCDKCVNCGGGCVLQWTNYSFSQLTNEIKY